MKTAFWIAVAFAAAVTAGSVVLDEYRTTTIAELTAE